MAAHRSGATLRAVELPAGAWIVAEIGAGGCVLNIVEAADHLV